MLLAATAITLGWANSPWAERAITISECCRLVARSAPRRSAVGIIQRVTDTTILVIDDEPQIRRVVRHALEDENVRVLEAASGRDGIDLAAAERPDLVVLDLGLPDCAGLDVCREIRGWLNAPVLVLSARHSDQEKAALLDAGADDYLTKPFSTVEFRARVRAQLRRSRMAPAVSGETGITAEGVTIDFVKRAVTRDGTAVHLTPVEWGLLRVLP